MISDTIALIRDKLDKAEEDKFALFVKSRQVGISWTKNDNIRKFRRELERMRIQVYELDKIQKDHLQEK